MSLARAVVVTLLSAPASVLFARGLLWLGTDKWQPLTDIDPWCIALMSMVVVGSAVGLIRAESK